MREITKKHVLVAKKKSAHHVGLANTSNSLAEPVTEKPIDDVRKYIDSSVLDSDNEELLSYDNKEQWNVIGVEFISTTILSGRKKCDHTMVLRIKYIPNWKILFPNKFG